MSLARTHQTRAALLTAHVLAMTAACGMDGEPSHQRWDLRGDHLSATLTTFGGRPWGATNGLFNVRDDRFPRVELFNPRQAGFYFEHILSGRSEDNYRSHFTTNGDPHSIVDATDNAAVLRHPGDRSAWGVESRMSFSIHEKGVDMSFLAIPSEDTPQVDQLVLMWASYLNHARARTLHFWGTHVDAEKSGPEEWIAFGENADGTPQLGAIRALNAAPVIHEDDADSRNLPDRDDFRFVLPFYFGLVDGDGDQATTNDTMVFAMMFDDAEAIRFALWNFNRDMDGEPDTHRPAWDWHFIIRNPQPGQEYAYRARWIYKPFVSAEDIMDEYFTWMNELPSKP